MFCTSLLIFTTISLEKFTTTTKGIVLADTRPIQALDNEQLEWLTNLRLANTWRAHARRSIIRQARTIRIRAYQVRMQYETDGQPPRAQTLRGLRRWLQALIGSMQMLRAEEAARQLENEIWASVQQ
ncbi:hypothetical protein NUH16_003677 [Penicillium rubens]|nr:hypothetical protein NUH16_003677 [Penicillium rubens]